MSDFDQKDIISSDFDPADVVEDHTEKFSSTKDKYTDEPYSHFGSDTLDKILSAVNTAGKVMDYPVAPIRETIGAALDLVQGKPVANPLKPLIAGPSSARTSKQLLEQAGVPETQGYALPLGVQEMMTPEELQGAPEYKLADVLSLPLDIATGSAAYKGLQMAGGAAGKALKGAGAMLVPEDAQHAYKRGLEGINNKSSEFYQNTSDELKDVTNKISEPIIKQSQAQQSLANNEVNALEKQLADHKMALATADAQSAQFHKNQIYDLENRLSDLKEQNKALNVRQKEIQTSLADQQIADTEVKLAQAQDQAQQLRDIELKKQQAKNAEDIHALNEEIAKTAQDFQKRIYDVKKELGKQYDTIDAAAEATGIKPDLNPTMNNFQDTLWHQSGLPEGEINSIMKKLVSTIDNKNGTQAFKNFKQVLSNYFEHANPVVRRAAKQAYGQLKQDYSQALAQGGFSQIADDMATTNKRWSAVNELENNFVSNLTPNRVTGQFEPSPDTIQAISNFGEKTAKNIASKDFLSNLLNIADPQQATTQIGSFENLASRQAGLKGFQPSAPAVTENPDVMRLQQLLDQIKASKQAPMTPIENPQIGQLETQLVDLKKPTVEMPQPPNPESVRLQQLLDQAKTKAVGASKIEGLDFNAANPEALQKELLSTLPKFGMKSGNEVAENKLTQLMEFLKTAKTPEEVEQIKKQLIEVNKDLAIRSGRSTQRDIPHTATGAAVEAVTGRGANNIANAIGRGVRKVNDVMGKELLQKGVTQISQYTPEEMSQLATRLASSGTLEGEQFARVLDQTKDKNTISKNAIIFGLMQQPKFREMLHDIYGQEAANGEDGR